MQDAATQVPTGAAAKPTRRPGALARKVRILAAANLILFAVTGLLGEVGLRLFWHPRFWVRSEDWLVGSGQGPAGRKWWPNGRFVIEGLEFWVRFRSDGRGYRARPAPPRSADPYRIAFVGDSFTEAMQVEYDQSFVARIERALAARAGGREIVAENFGVAGSGFFDYWHRITHDVFRPGTTAPQALVLCVFPGNDFIEHCPDAGFAPDGRPLREYFRRPGWSQHALAWLNLHSKLVHFVLRSLHIAALGVGPPQLNAPPFWWNDPATASAAARTSPHVRHVRALMRAIHEECDRHGTRLVIVIIPSPFYPARGAYSPLATLFGDWGLSAPVIDVSARARTIPRPSRLSFPVDGHLNPEGHQFVTDTALEPLARALNIGTKAR